jgi:processive 1,2-diacylglycerol beta-glucosyltransferase
LCKRKYALSIREIINEFEPEVFVSTHPFTTLGVVTLKERGITKAPLVVVATDFDVHSFSINEWVDLFVVPCAEVSKYLQQKGIPSSKIEVFGIPVAPKFYLTKGKRELRVNLGLKKELPVILLISGAFGVTPIRELVTSFRNFNLPVQFLIVCGRNKKLKRVLEKEFGRLKLFGRVFGFVENMEELMEASDLIVTKPGGLICAEAAAKGLPMILLNPIKGQETKNAKTLLKARCALQPAGIKEAHEKILTLLTNTDLFEEMRANVRRITSPNSAIKIAYAVISLR